MLGPAAPPIALHEPEFHGREWEYVKDCIDTGWVSSAGSYVDRLEREFAGYVGAEYAVATVNGTAALHLCLHLVSVGPGDEVIAPALSFAATANAISYCGAIPHFVDVSILTLGMDPAKLAAYIGEIGEMRSAGLVNRVTGRRIGAVVPMHTFGHPMAIDPLKELCARYRLPLIEDAAEAVGSTLQGRHCGTFGVLGAYSFNGNKIVTTGGGGMIVTNDPALARRAKHLSTTAKEPHPWEYVHDEVGFNYRLPNINAALGCAQLERLPGFLERKRKLARAYETAFDNVSEADFVKEPEGAQSNYWLNAILVGRCGETTIRDGILNALNESGYRARPAWRLLHKLVPYMNSPRMPDLSIAEDVERRLVNLPSSAHLADRLA